MCEAANEEDAGRKADKERDVDDLIFRDEREWLKSDR